MARFVPTKELVGMDAPVLDESTARMVAVKNVPVVGEEKFDKLCTVMKKVMGRAGALAEHEYAFFMPKNDDGKTKGVVFVEYADVKGAKEAVAKLNGMKLDSAHLLEVIPFAQFDETRDLPETFVPPQHAEFVPREQNYDWMESAEIVRGWEMYATWIKNETQIAKFNPKEPKEPVVVHRGDGFSLPSFAWSPNGSYFVSMHPQGAMVFPVYADEIAASPKLKMALKGVAYVDFSPQERYAMLRTAKDSQSLLYDVQMEKVMLKFQAAPEPFAWDFAERFCVRLAPKAHGPGKEGAIEVFNVEKRALSYIPMPQLSVLSMSPRDGIAACFTPEAENRAACIALVDIPTGKVVRSHMVHKALSCAFYWHPDGRYLAAVVDSFTKGKRRVSALTLFRMTERGYPFEHIDEPSRHIAQFAWEPGYGTHFAYVSTEPLEQAPARKDESQDAVQVPLRKACVAIYDMRTAAAKAARVTLLPEKRASLLSWAPQQGVLLICDLLTSNGAIEFYSLACARVIATVQHFNAKDVRWDPSGRFVAVVSPANGRSGDAGYELFSFTGKLVEKATKMNFEQFAWRPRPPCALTAAEVQNIRKNLNKYRAEFQLDEKREREARDRAANEKLLAKSRAFQDIMGQLLAIYDAEADKRLALTKGFNPTDPDRFIVVEKSVTETVLSDKK